MSDRNFEPTPARRQQAFEAGRFPRSVDISGLLVFVTAMFLLMAYGDELLGGLRGLLVSQFQQLTLDQRQFMAAGRQGGAQIAFHFALPAAGALCLVAFLSQVAQGGWAWSPRRTVPDVSRLGPRASGSRGALCIGLLIKLGVVAVAMIYLVRVRWISLFATKDATRFFDSVEAAKALCVSALQLALAVGIAVALDYAWALWRYQQSLRMTAEEMREENRDRTRDSRSHGRRASPPVTRLSSRTFRAGGTDRRRATTTGSRVGANACVARQAPRRWPAQSGPNSKARALERN